jgi:hypothetical protein
MQGRIVVATAVALLAASSARAQDMRAICQKAFHPPVGAWSEFRSSGGSHSGGTMRMAVVGKETRGGQDFYWLEFSMRGFRTGEERGPMDTMTVINKMLAPSYGPGMEQARAHIIKFGSLPAMEMQEGGQAPDANPSMLDDCERSQVVGWERVTVPGGTFRALHVKDPENGSDTWVDPDLPFALVKGNDNSDSSMVELVSHGMGARSQITETPRPFDPRVLMQLMTGGRARP